MCMEAIFNKLKVNMFSSYYLKEIFVSYGFSSFSRDLKYLHNMSSSKTRAEMHTKIFKHNNQPFFVFKRPGEIS